MNPTETRKLGKSGVALTQLGFGGAPLGELFVRVDEPTAAATLQAAWDAGVRYYDTAPYYGRGLSEIRYGRFLDAKPRSDFVLSSKVGRWFFPPARPDEFQTGPVWAGGLRFEHVHDYSYDGIMRSYEQSQMRLGMNRIDLCSFTISTSGFIRPKRKSRPISASSSLRDGGRSISCARMGWCAESGPESTNWA